MSSLREILGTNLKSIRKAMGLSQAALAEQAEISVDMLGRIERGTAAPSFETIEALAKVLKVSPPSLFGAADFSAATSDRSRTLQQITADLARASDDQVFLIRRLISAVIDRQN